jgi:hypothetical protein
MEKFEVNRNPKPLLDEQINRHKNFDKLIGDHSKLTKYKTATQPLYKNKKFMGLMILISIVTLVLVMDTVEESESKKTIDQKVTDSISVSKKDTLID